MGRDVETLSLLPTARRKRKWGERFLIEIDMAPLAGIWLCVREFNYYAQSPVFFPQHYMQKKKQPLRRSPRPLGWWAVKHFDCCAGFRKKCLNDRRLLKWPPTVLMLCCWQQMPRLGSFRVKNPCSGCLSNEFTAEILELKTQRQQDHCKFQASIVSFRPTRATCWDSASKKNCFEKIFHGEDHIYEKCEQIIEKCWL